MSAMVLARSLGLIVWFIAALGAPSAWAQDAIRRGPVPGWVEVAADVPSTAGTTDEAIRILLFDTQFRAEADQQSYHMRSRSQVLSPQGLTFMGNVGLAWSPSSQSVTVHHVNIVRDGETIDVLATQAFETLRREENLELAMLDGILTASLQPAGLRVGDILDMAYTIVSRDPVVGEHVEQAIDLNLPATIDRVRYRASWPRALPVRLRASNDWVDLDVRRDGDHDFVEVRREAVQPVVVPIDVPIRMHAVNRIELSDYRDWSDIAVALKPLYDRARRLDESSPLKAQIERIRALSDDPSVQAAAALRLVQDEVRYVALMMGEGALTPATADETWTRRFGDCKAKTALLLALLDGLGIAAEPAAVSLLAGDGLNERLPMIGAFDHVLVRAVVASEVRWLDGTRTGDRRLEDVAVPPFGWALPLTGPDAALEALVVEPRTTPDMDLALTVDASAGLYAPATVEGTMVMRSEAASVLGGQLGVIAATQKEQGLRSLWSAQLNDTTIAEVASSYDADASVLTLTMNGTVTLDWRSEGLIPPGSTYRPMSASERPEGPFRSAPYAVNHPMFTRQVATLRLPQAGTGFRVSGGEVDRTELGHHLRRAVRLDGDQVTIETTLRSLTSEITAEDATEARRDEAARRHDPPRVFASADYRPTEADCAALEADTPTTADGWLDRAFALSRANDAQGAFEAADKAVELAPDSSSAWANRGVYRFWIGDLEGAATDLEKAIDIDPSERVVMNGHALLARAEGRHQDVVIEMTRALRQAPTDTFALNMRTQAYVELKQYDRALRDADALIATSPDDMQLRLNRAAVLRAAGRTEEAAVAIVTSAGAEPDDHAVRLAQAQLAIADGRPGEALALLDAYDNEVLQATSAEPVAGAEVVVVDAGARLIAARAALALGQDERARLELSRLREAFADDADMLNSLCWMAAEAGRLLDQALRDCDAALALEPESAVMIDGRARVLLEQGDAREALAGYEAALAREPALATSLYGRGLARVALGQAETGEEDKAAALEIDPTVAQLFQRSRPRPSGG